MGRIDTSVYLNLAYLMKYSFGVVVVHRNCIFCIKCNFSTLGYQSSSIRPNWLENDKKLGLCYENITIIHMRKYYIARIKTDLYKSYVYLNKIYFFNFFEPKGPKWVVLIHQCTKIWLTWWNTVPVW